MVPRILTVDDSKVIRMIVSRAFKPFACEVLEAADGVEGMAVAKRERPDLIILDVTMPVMDGMEMLTKMRSDPELKGIPVVMLTAEAGRDNVLRIARLGVRDYLVKPFKEDMIIERVSRIIELKDKAEMITRRFEDSLRLLVVDDKPAIIKQIQEGLADTAWKVEGASQAGEAVDYCSLHPPDVVLVSLSLPENSAFLLFQALRASTKTRSTPVLGLSVKIAVEEQVRSQQAGFGAVVTKPIDPDDLKQKITRALNLDTSHRYFEHTADMLVVRLPRGLHQAIANEISTQFPSKLTEAVDAGSTKLVLDLSAVTSTDVTLIKLVINAIQLCDELDVQHSLIGSDAVQAECKNYEETKDWQFATTFDQALAVLNGKTPVIA